MGRTRSPLGGPDALLGLGIACMVAESITPSGKEESVINVSDEWDAREIPRFPPSKHAVFPEWAAVVIRIYQPTSAGHSTGEGGLCESVARIQLR